MGVNRVRLKSHSKRKQTQTPDDLRLAALGAPQLLDGEKLKHYEDLATQLRGAVKPLDMLDEIFVHDLERLQWDILRGQRLKKSLIAAAANQGLSGFVRQNLPFEVYQQELLDDLSEVLAARMTQDDNAEAAADMARRCIDDEEQAVQQAEELLAGSGMDWDFLNRRAQAAKATAVLDSYALGDSRAIKTVESMLADAGVTLDDLTAKSLAESVGGKEMDYLAAIERLD